uniref:Immunoglobulin V-set domain-containing protein n=1 Tax=Bos indicus x Bos taurus TaxID=30522 RepID=A0A4W2DK82_BOBOX
MERNTLPASWLILWLHLVSSLLTVEQRPPLLWVQEGDSTNFICSFPSSSFYALHWYRWKPEKGPKNLFVISVNGDEKKQGRVRLCASTQCPSALCSPYPNPCLLLLCDQH